VNQIFDASYTSQKAKSNKSNSLHNIYVRHLISIVAVIIVKGEHILYDKLLNMINNYLLSFQCIVKFNLHNAIDRNNRRINKFF
jgi:hypothetical protein